MTPLSQRLRDWRRRLKPRVNQTQLGALVGVSQSMITAWETGRSTVDAKHWPALATALQLSEAETQQLRTALLDQYVEAA